MASSSSDPALKQNASLCSWEEKFHLSWSHEELTKRGSLEHCVGVIEWMKNQKNYCARTDIYNLMIKLYARHNHADQACGWFFEMQQWRCKPDAETYNALINAHGRKGQW